MAEVSELYENIDPEEAWQVIAGLIVIWQLRKHHPFLFKILNLMLWVADEGQVCYKEEQFNCLGFSRVVWYMISCFRMWWSKYCDWNFRENNYRSAGNRWRASSHTEHC